MFFSGEDLQNQLSGQIWSTNGVSAAAISPDASAPIYAAMGAKPVRLGDDLYFVGESNSQWSLYATDGTSAGTSAVLALGSAGAAVNFGGRLVVVTGQGLYLSDGTAGGTVEVATGDFGGLYDPVAIGDSLYFLEFNASTQSYALWRLDGSTNSATKLSDDAINLTAAGGELYCSGGSASSGEYRYDPVSGTITEISSVRSLGAPLALGAAATDLTGAGVSDIVWRNQTSGAVYGWDMLADAHVGNEYYGETGSQCLGSGAFAGGATSDLLFQSQSGAVDEWVMQNGAHVDDVALGNLSGWQATIGDVTGDGTADIVWKSQSTGDVWLWTMTSGQHTASSYLGNLSGWDLVAAGDVNGDGVADLVWKNQTSGDVYAWTMSDGAVSGSVYLGNAAGYTLAASGDFAGDGRTDFVWQSQTTGDTWQWGVTGAGAHSSDVYLGGTAGYSVAAEGDFSGAGTDGVVWQGANAGDAWLWTFTNGAHTGNAYLGATSGWTAV